MPQVIQLSLVAPVLACGPWFITFQTSLCCVWQKRAGEIQLSLHFLVSVCTSASSFLAALFPFFCPFSPIVLWLFFFFFATVSLSGVTCVENVPTVCWGEVLMLLKWSPLTLSSLGCVCEPACSPGSVRFSLVVEVVGLRCLKTSLGVPAPLKTGPRANPKCLLLLVVRFLRGYSTLLPWGSAVLLPSTFLGHTVALLASNTLFSGLNCWGVFWKTPVLFCVFSVKG